jgi:hypothetical protein
MLDKRVLRTIFGRQRKAGEDSKIRGFITYAFQKMLLG